MTAPDQQEREKEAFAVSLEMVRDCLDSDVRNSPEWRAAAKDLLTEAAGLLRSTPPEPVEECVNCTARRIGKTPLAEPGEHSRHFGLTLTDKGWVDNPPPPQQEPVAPEGWTARIQYMRPVDCACGYQAMAMCAKGAAQAVWICTKCGKHGTVDPPALIRAPESEGS